MLFKRCIIIAVLIASIFSFPLPQNSSAQGEMAMATITIVHAIPDAPPVDIYVNGELAIEALEFDASQNFIRVPSGATDVVVSATGTSIDDSLLEISGVELAANTDYLMIALGNIAAGNIELMSIDMNDAFADHDPLGTEASTLFLHAVDGLGPITNRIDGQIMFEGLAYGDYIVVDAPTTDFDEQNVLTNDPLTILSEFSVPGEQAGSRVILILTGTYPGEFDETYTYFYLPFTPLNAIEYLNYLTANDFPQSGTYNTLITAIETAGLTAIIANDIGLHLAAPNDAAFAELEDGVLNELLANTEALTDVLLYHATTEELFMPEEPTEIETLQGNLVTLAPSPIGLTVNDALVRQFIATRTGVVTLIDGVLIPPSE